MANRLKMAIVSSILTLAKRGWSQRRIARELGISRTTVRNSGDIHEQVHVKTVADGFCGLFQTSIRRHPKRERQ